MGSRAVDNLWISDDLTTSSHLFPPLPGRGQKPHLSSSRFRYPITEEGKPKIWRKKNG